MRERRSISLVVALVLVVSLLVGCQAALEPAATQAPTTAPTLAPTAEATQNTSANAEERPFVMLASDVVTSLDPAEDFSMGGGSGVMVHIYDTLMNYTGTETAEIVPVLLTEVPSQENGGISADGLTYTFHLKPNAKFHDGSPVNAEAVKFSIERQIKLAMGPNYYWAGMDHLEVVDETTFKVILAQPSAFFLNMIAAPWASRIVNPAVVKANEKDGDLAAAYLQDHDGGSGPYILESWERDLKQITMVRDPNYWGGWNSGPHIERVVVRWVAESSTIRSMLEKGDADVATGLTFEDWEALGETAGITTYSYPALFTAQIYLNNAVPPFDNPKVRQAMKASFDAQSIIDDVMGGMAFPVDGQASYLNTGASKPKNPITFDLENAKQLLSEAGVQNLEFTVKDPGLFRESSSVLEVWQATLAQIGVNMSIEKVDQGAFYSALQSPDNPDIPVAFMSNTMGDFPDAWSIMNYNLNPEMGPPGCCNYSLYDNPKVTELLKTAAQTYDPAERAKYYQEIYDITEEDMPLLWPFGFKQMVAMRDSVKGYAYNLALGYQYLPLETMTIE